jgi:hypothetical protein
MEYEGDIVYIVNGTSQKEYEISTHFCNSFFFPESITKCKKALCTAGVYVKSD